MATIDRDVILGDLRSALRENIVTLKDVHAVIRSLPVAENGVVQASKPLNISGVLYYIGASIVFIGIGIFISDHWKALSSLLRILVTLAAGLAFFATGVLLESTKRLDRVSDAFHFLAGLLIPGGVFVMLYEFGFRGNNWGPGIIFFMLSLCYVLVHSLYRNNLLLAFGLAYGIASFFLLTEAMVGNFPSFNWNDFYAYRFVGIGVSLFFLGYAFRNTPRRPLSFFLYPLGALALLGGAFALQGWNPHQSVFWEIVYPGLVFAVMFLSIHLQSKWVLFLGAAFLVGNIFKLTNEYFRDSLSWPLMLVFSGFLLIGVGYLTVYLSQKYIRS